MSINALAFISNYLGMLGINYAFAEWKGAIPDRYFVGEYIEVASLTKEENGFQETDFILNGFTRKTWLSLEQDKQIIEGALPIKHIFEDGSGITINYGTSQVIPTGDAQLKRIQINLSIKEWKV